MRINNLSRKTLISMISDLSTQLEAQDMELEAARAQVKTQGCKCSAGGCSGCPADSVELTDADFEAARVDSSGQWDDWARANSGRYDVAYEPESEDNEKLLAELRIELKNAYREIDELQGSLAQDSECDCRTENYIQDDLVENILKETAKFDAQVALPVVAILHHLGFPQPAEVYAKMMGIGLLGAQRKLNKWPQ